MTTIEVKNDYMLGRQNENILYYKCMELEQENKQLKKKYENAVSDYEQEHYKIVKAIEYIKNNREIRTFYTPEQRWEVKEDFIKGYYELLEILGGNNENIL